MLKALIISLVGMLLVPFIWTWLLFHSQESEGRCRGKFLAGMILNLLGNGAVIFGVLSWRFQTRELWKRLSRMIQLRCTFQDVGTLAMVLIICLFMSIIWGLLLRLLLYGSGRRISVRRRTALLGMAAICVAVLLEGRAVSSQSSRYLHIEEVYRKISADYLRTGTLAWEHTNTKNVSSVTIYNSGELDYALSEIWLSDSEDDPQAVCFRDVLVPAEYSRNLIMDYDRGIDLGKDGSTTVYLREADGRMIDQVSVPGLREGEGYRSGKDGKWEIIDHHLTRKIYAVEAPQFTVPSGFYDQPFYLEMTGPAGARIYYTLDGSDPTTGSLLYAEPLLVQDRTPEENCWSMRTDVVSDFFSGEIPYSLPEGPVDKCTMVRAICVDAEGQISDTTTASYFIGYTNREGYQNLRVVSIVTDPENLFGAENGIYVLGNMYLKEYDPEREEKRVNFWSQNFREKGKAWERVADVQIFDVDHRLLLNKKLGIRIKGSSSVEYLPKGLKLYARDAYDGEPMVPVDIFGSGYPANRIGISMGGTDMELKVRDWLMTRLAGDFGVDMPHYIPCCVFLEGEYWGAGWLMEQLNEEFFSYYHDIDLESIMIVKKTYYSQDEHKDAQLMETLDYIADHDMKNPENYITAGELMDLENTIRYFALEIYSGNTDWKPTSNLMAWRTAVPREEGQGEGKWRWALFDVNHFSVFGDAHLDAVQMAKERFPFFRSLMENESFRSRFYETLQILAEEVFAPERTAKALEEYRELMGEALQADHMRFYNSDIDLSKLDEIQRFFEERAEYILEECEKHLER